MRKVSEQSVASKLLTPKLTPKLLTLSNGHGEDLNASLILQALQSSYSQLELAAMPLVGEGKSYQKLGIPIVGPTQTMPSGGMVYMNPLVLLRDLGAGLPALLWRQIWALRRSARTSDLLLSVGDLLVVALAQLTGRPYIAMLCAHSSYYEGRVNLGFWLWRCLASPQCLAVFTRDALTAKDLQQQGLSKAQFVGMPVMDALGLQNQGLCQDLPLKLQVMPGRPLIGLLPGSRLPEALENLSLQLQLVSEIGQTHPQPLQFYAALVPELLPELPTLAQRLGWEWAPDKLIWTSPSGSATPLVVSYTSNGFAELLHQSQVVIGMAGTAVEQAVGLGKPVLALPGRGPQYTYRFAEAQARLLGPSVVVIGTGPADGATLRQAANKLEQILADTDYRQQCQQNGRERLGAPGGSREIANYLAASLGLETDRGLSR